MEFRLVVQAPASSPKPKIRLHDKSWHLTDRLDIRSRGDAIPPYTCISYVWGAGRTANPFYTSEDGAVMSTRILAVLGAAMRSDNARAFWIDAFCIPVESTAKRATLESMVFIYSRAKKVVVVLPDASLAAIEEMGRLVASEAGVHKLPLEPMDTLENDPWIRSVWTYQEAVNSREMAFIGEVTSGKVLSAATFLDDFGHYLCSYRKLNDISAEDFAGRYPYLSRFENLVGDWMALNRQPRTALQVISGMHGRIARDPTHYFYSMIGAMTDKPVRRPRGADATDETLSDTFMLVCEEENDFSYIFTSNDRDTKPGCGWRPSPGLLLPLVEWHSFGERQPGAREFGVVKLKKMALSSHRSNFDDRAEDYFVKWLKVPHRQIQDGTITETIFEELEKMGVTGADTPYTVTSGVFFPQKAIDAPKENVAIWVSSALRLLDTDTSAPYALLPLTSSIFEP